MVIYSGKIWYSCALTTLKIVNYLDIQTHDERKRAFDKNEYKRIIKILYRDIKPNMSDNDFS